MKYNYTTKKPYGIDPRDYHEFGEYKLLETLLTKRGQRILFTLFEELDGLIFDYLPTSLTTTPVKLIQTEFLKKTGLYLTQQEILDAYKRFEGENDD